MKKILLSLILISTLGFAQVGIGTINPTGALDVSSSLPLPSTNKAGFVPPTVSLTATNSNITTTGANVVNPSNNLTPVVGTLVYNSNTSAIGVNQVVPGYYYYDGTTWILMSTGKNSDWSTTGNSATTPGTNFIGTTDAQALIIKSAAIERMRILADGRISINNATPTATDKFSVYNTTASDYAISGYSTQTGIGVFGQNTGTGIGVYGFNSSNGSAVVGINTSTTGTGGAGIYGDSSNNSSAGIFGNSATNGGVGVYGQVSGGGQSRGVSGYTNGSNKKSYALYGLNLSTTSGTAFTSSNTAASIYGDAVSIGNYKFGMYGDGGSNTRSGGVIGNNFIGSGGTAGALGYYNSASVNYAVYGFTGAYQTGAAGGRMSSNNQIGENISIGLGIYGGVMGGWVRGLKYGFHTKGETYSLYIDGDSYTNQPIALLTDSDNERVASYMTTSMKPEITSNGKSNLVNGKVFISFNSNFNKISSAEDDIIINITPQGNSKGVYVTNITKEGFWIYENENGNSNIKIFWSATATIKNTTGKIVPSDLLAKDFDKKMDGVMFNDNNANETAQPLWWDGTKIRWDIPENKKNTNSQELQESRRIPIANAAQTRTK